MSKLVGIACVLAAMAVAGCDNGGGGTGSDSGVTPQDDAGTGGNEGGTPGNDSGTPPQSDSGTPPGDGGGPTDALGQADARVRDPRIMSDPDPDQVACGSATCVPSNGEVCCVSMTGMTCKAAASCTGLAAPAACDGPEDCPAGQRCCIGFPSGAKCTAGACSGNTQDLCNYNDNCASGNCTPCKGPGADLVYGLCTASGTCPSPYTSP
jgi:hypothetical protein